jgi:hypothetical protein
VLGVVLSVGDGDVVAAPAGADPRLGALAFAHGWLPSAAPGDDDTDQRFARSTP